jgi:16S rRNA (adenine1518-N6/adenine1519-N6)-dimethyltransferase
MKRRGARLGQHFLIHGWPASKLAHAIEVRKGETIVEIGPGKGILTKELLKFGPVLAIEKDPALILKLQDSFSGEIAERRLTLINADVRDVSPEFFGLKEYVVAANIPYYITGEIIRQFLTSAVQPRAMALLVQKEVANRIVAKNGKESILSLSVKAYGEPRIIAKVGKSHFSPPPSVDSAIIVIDSVSKDFFADISEEEFFTVVRTGFSSKRKVIANTLTPLFEDVQSALAHCDIDVKTRPEDISIHSWKCLSLVRRTLHRH